MAELFVEITWRWSVVKSLWVHSAVVSPYSDAMIIFFVSKKRKKKKKVHFWFSPLFHNNKEKSAKFSSYYDDFIWLSQTTQHVFNLHESE